MMDGDTPVAVFAVADAIREESRAAIDRLHQQSI
jgi:cation transport ATPase